MILLPKLTEADPRISAEGSIDPLGMYAIADALAVRLIPGVRERQKHPRFLTTMAVSLSLCSEMDEDLIASDGVSEPQQVFEWHVVEGLVRTSEKEKLRGVPGQDKAATAIKDRVPISAKRYLKTPSVFGFHGVYRALSRDLEIERADRLGEIGYELLSVWEKEQGLIGFSGTQNGPGKSKRSRLLDAIHDGLADGAVARSPGWAMWKFFSQHLGIYDSTRREGKVIGQALMNPTSGDRRELLDFVISEKGKELWHEQVQSKDASERVFHKAVRSIADSNLGELLDAISIYERFCRYLQDAFDDCLFHMSQYQQKIQPLELSRLESVKLAAKEVPEIFSEITERLTPFGQLVRFQDHFSSLAERTTALNWLERLMQHHTTIQRQKPPAGKAPWYDQFDDGSLMIRTGYVRNKGGRHDDHYVHAYRTGSLWSFVCDLGLVK